MKDINIIIATVFLALGFIIGIVFVLNITNHYIESYCESKYTLCASEQCKSELKVAFHTSNGEKDKDNFDDCRLQQVLNQASNLGLYHYNIQEETKQ